MRKILGVIGVGALLALAACSGSDSASVDTTDVKIESTEAAAPVELTKMKLGLDWTWLAYHMPFEWALQNGYYEEIGIDLEILEGQGSGNTVKFVATGEVDFGFADSSALVQAIAAGADIRNVAVIWQTANFAMVCNPEVKVRVPKDLEGKSVLVIPSENVSAVMPVFFEQNDVDIKKVKVLNADYTNKQALFIEKKADCMAGVDGQDVLIVRYSRPDITDDDVMRWADFGTNAPGHGLVTSNSLIASKPDLVRGFVQASIRAWKEVCANEQIGIDLYLAKFPTASDNDKQFAKDNLPYECGKTKTADGTAFGPTDDAFWQALIDAQVRFNAMENAPTVEAVYTNEFLN